MLPSPETAVQYNHMIPQVRFCHEIFFSSISDKQPWSKKKNIFVEFRRRIQSTWIAIT